MISDIPAADVPAVKEAIVAPLGLDWTATSVRAGLVACTGAAGCKYAGAHTKQDATAVADYLDGRLRLDTPVNLHLTGCHNSCAQHFIGDLGMIGTKVAVGEDLVEGYHLFVGGGYGNDAEIGRELYRDVPSTDLPAGDRADPERLPDAPGRAGRVVPAVRRPAVGRRVEADVRRPGGGGVKRRVGHE